MNTSNMSTSNSRFPIPLALTFAVILVALYPACNASAAETLQWDYPTGVSITGFKVYCAKPGAALPSLPTVTVPATERTATVQTQLGRVNCVAKAYDADGESGPSNSVSYIERPTNLKN